jgi:hypothetical protein
MRREHKRYTYRVERNKCNFTSTDRIACEHADEAWHRKVVAEVCGGSIVEVAVTDACSCQGPQFASRVNRARSEDSSHRVLQRLRDAQIRTMSTADRYLQSMTNSPGDWRAASLHRTWPYHFTGKVIKISQPEKLET